MLAKSFNSLLIDKVIRLIVDLSLLIDGLLIDAIIKEKNYHFRASRTWGISGTGRRGRDAGREKNRET